MPNASMIFPQRIVIRSIRAEPTAPDTMTSASPESMLYAAA